MDGQGDSYIPPPQTLFAGGIKITESRLTTNVSHLYIDTIMYTS